MLTRNCRRCFGSSVQIAYSALPPALVNIERTKCYRSTRLCGKGWTGSGAVPTRVVVTVTWV